jgi:hypothetical protein
MEQVVEEGEIWFQWNPPSLPPDFAQEQQEYVENTKDVGNERLDFRFAY